MHKEATLDGFGVPSANFTTLQSLRIRALQLSVWQNVKFAEGARKSRIQCFTVSCGMPFESVICQYLWQFL